MSRTGSSASQSGVSRTGSAMSRTGASNVETAFSRTSSAYTADGTNAHRTVQSDASARSGSLAPDDGDVLPSDSSTCTHFRLPSHSCVLTLFCLRVFLVSQRITETSQSSLSFLGALRQCCMRQCCSRGLNMLHDEQGNQPLQRLVTPMLPLRFSTFRSPSTRSYAHGLSGYD